MKKAAPNKYYRGLDPRSASQELYCIVYYRGSILAENFTIMPERCVVFGCSNTADRANGIFLYQIPFWDDTRHILVKRRKNWVDFVKRKRDKWTPTRSSVVCSKHFTEDCFEYGSDTVPKYRTPRLKKDEHGVSVFPTIFHINVESSESERTQRLNKRRKVCVKRRIALVKFAYIILQYIVNMDSFEMFQDPIKEGPIKDSNN